jgi:ubiquinone/menaquinone biosynthesis C-methylase UbiE
MLGMRLRGAEGFFDRWAATYDRSIHQKLIFEPIHRAVLDAHDGTGAAPRDVLDVGCGTGRLLEAAARSWGEARFTGVDVSKAMVAEAQRKHEGDPRFMFQHGDAAALTLESVSFDAVFSTMSFHHWRDQAQGLREVGRVLRPGGHFVLADVNVPFLSLIRPLIDWCDHATFQTPDDLERLFKEAGLTTVAVRRFWRVAPVQLLVARKLESARDGLA